MTRRTQTFLDLVANLGWPFLVLTWWSGDDALGPRWGPALAMALPLAWAVYRRIVQGYTSPIAALVVTSIALNAAVGFLPMDARWFALKEAVMPMGFGAIFVLTTLRGPGILAGLINEMLDADKVNAALAETGGTEIYTGRIRRGTRLFGLVTALSGVVSGVLATVLITSPTGSTEFAVQLGRYTAWSYGAVTLPTLLGTMWVLRDVLTTLETTTGKPFETLLPG
jgi:hypothetical protein